MANNFKYEDPPGIEDVDNKYCCFLVFVYDINSPDKDPRVYSSINRALKGLQISYGTLLDYINNNYLYKSNFILSFEPFVADDIRAILQAKKYQEKSRLLAPSAQGQRKTKHPLSPFYPYFRCTPSTAG